jgi:hypothetical protein
MRARSGLKIREWQRRGCACCRIPVEHGISMQLSNLKRHSYAVDSTEESRLYLTMRTHGCAARAFGSPCAACRSKESALSRGLRDGQVVII